MQNPAPMVCAVAVWRMTGQGEAQGHFYCTSERSYTPGEQNRLHVEASNLNFTVSRLKSLISQINLARSNSCSNVSYANGLVEQYNFQLRGCQMDADDHNFAPDRLNRRIDSYNSACTD